MKLLLSLTLVMAAAKAEVTIDLAKAVFDEDLGQFCVMQKVSFINKCHVHRAKGKGTGCQIYKYHSKERSSF